MCLLSNIKENFSIITPKSFSVASHPKLDWILMSVGVTCAQHFSPLASLIM